MTISKNTQYERILYIDEIIATGTRPTWEKIQSSLDRKGFNASRATIFRDLKALQEDFHAPLDIDFNNGYFYTEPTFRLPALFTNENKIRAAKLIRNLLETIKGTPLYKEACEVFDTLSTVAPVVNSTGKIKDESVLRDDITNRVVFLGAPNVTIKPETWRVIYGALQNNQIVSFKYKAMNIKEIVQRSVKPYQLIFDNGNWNLFCFDMVNKERRLYTLSEMSNVKLLDGKRDAFALPKDYDFFNITPGTFGSWYHGKYKMYKIHLEGYAARAAKDRLWGRNQKIEKDTKNTGSNKDGIILTFESNQHAPIVRWVLGWGKEAVALEPTELVKDCEEAKDK